MVNDISENIDLQYTNNFDIRLCMCVHSNETALGVKHCQTPKNVVNIYNSLTKLR